MKSNPLFEDDDSSTGITSPGPGSHMLTHSIATPFNTGPVLQRAHSTASSSPSKSIKRRSVSLEDLRAMAEEEGGALPPVLASLAAAASSTLGNTAPSAADSPKKKGTLARREKARFMSLRTPKRTEDGDEIEHESIGKSLAHAFGSIRIKFKQAITSKPDHVCKPIAEGMSKCVCGRSW